MGHLHIETYYSLELPIKSSLILYFFPHNISLYSVAVWITWFTTNLIVKNPAGDFFTCQKNIKRILGFNIAIQNSKQVNILCTLIQININRCRRHII